MSRAKHDLHSSEKGNVGSFITFMAMCVCWVVAIYCKVGNICGVFIFAIHVFAIC